MLTLIRGLPGEGKTTLAKGMTGAMLVSADDYMVDNYGNYSFDPSQLSLCHALCQARAILLLGDGHHVVVHNTFVKNWEMSPYRAAAHALNVKCEIESVHNAILASNSEYINALAARNVHGVPARQIARMAFDWQSAIPDDEFIRRLKGIRRE